MAAGPEKATRRLGLSFPGSQAPGLAAVGEW